MPVRLSAAIVVVCLALAGIVLTGAESPGNSPFRRTWARTDKAVADLKTSRTWMWGPQANTALLWEDYAESPDGRRVVQYYDKSRMEITQPAGDPSVVWYVTNGLLSTELISGRMQLGDNTFEQRAPAEVNVAGDAGDPNGPTYATFNGLLDDAAPEAETAISRGVRRDGTLYVDSGYAAHNIGTVQFTAETGHWIAAPFWTFMNSTGLVYENGLYATANLFLNPYYATGYPITDAYWANVVVGGTPKHVLIQCFERRCLTYTPGNPAGFETEAGNVGQHYYAWRYAGQPPTLAPTPTPTPTPAMPSSATWRQIAPASPAPQARNSHTLAANPEGTRVYLFGGRTGGQVRNDLWVYDVESNVWSQLAPSGGPPAARFGHNAAYDAVNQRVVVYGGQGASGFFSDVWAYNVNANAWELLAPQGSGPLDRYGAGGAYDPTTNTFYISHGFTSDGRFDDTWGYRLSGGGWQDDSAGGARPEPRCLLDTIADPARNRLLLFGGQSNTAGFLGDLWSFDLGSRTWTQLNASGPSGRNLYSWTERTGSDTALLFGGATASGSSDQLWAFDLSANTWTLVPASSAAPSARNSHDAVWLAGRSTLLVFGGHAGGVDLNDLWEAALE